MNQALLYRAAVTEANGIDVAAGTARLSFSSEHPVLRRGDKKHGTHIEILSHAPGDVNNSILERGAPVLLDHNDSQVIGSVARGTFQVGSDRRGRASIEVDKEWRNYLQAIADGEAPNAVSVGYSTLSIVKREEGANGIPILTFSWLPEEISILTKGNPPADPRVGIGRSLNMKTSLDDILALAISGSRRTPDEDWSDISLIEALAQVGEAKSGRVREMFESTRRHYAGPLFNGVPFSVIAPRLTRDMTAGVFPSGGAFVPDQMQDGTPLLFNASVTRRLGATFVTGLEENWVKPKITAAPTVAALGEISQVAVSQILTAADDVKPIRLSVTVTLSAQWLRQTSPGAEALVRKTVADAVNTQMDYLAVFGTGGNDQPLGLMQQVGVQSAVYGGPATFTGLLAQEQALAQANIPESSFGWAISPQTRARWKAIARAAGNSFFLIENGRALDYPALASNQMSGTHQSVFGAWPTFLVLIWGNALDMTMDRITGAAKGECYLTAHLWFNVQPLYPQAFVVSADAANQ
jgi:HK97 family phage major capsid protein